MPVDESQHLPAADASADYLNRTWWQHIAGFGIAGPGLVLLAWDVVDRTELLRVGAAWLGLTTVMAIAFAWASREPTRWSRHGLLLALLVAAPKVILGSSLVLIPSGRYSLEFLYLVSTVLFGVAAGTTITLGPIYRLSSAAMYACFVPLALSLLALRQWIMFSALTAFLIVLVAVALTRLSSVYRELAVVRSQLAERVERAEEDARTDWLTGLLNRQGLESTAAEFGEAAVGSVYIDLDGFKELNDTYGHEAGDIALTRVAGVLRSSVRDTDIVARLGGDEFMVLVQGVSSDELAELADRILVRLTQIQLEFGRDQVSVNASLGLALDAPGEFDLQAALQVTDAALYAAKRSGRNRAVWSGETALIDLGRADATAE